MSLSDLLLFLTGRNSTGTLQLSLGNEWRRLYFEEGRIISSGSSNPTDWLGHFLIAENKITEAQLTRAMEVQEKTKVMLGKILVMIGAVTEEELLDMLEDKCEESLLGMFLWVDADFEFLDHELPAVRMIPTSMEVEPLVREGLRRLEEWKRLTKLYPSKEIRFDKNLEFVSDPVLRDSFAQKVYQLADRRNTIGDIILQTHAMDYKVLRALEGLKEKNLIRIVSYGPERAEEKGSHEIPPAQIIDTARERLAFGKWEEAINLCRYLLDHEENPEIRELLSKAEQGLIQTIYEEVVAPEAVLYAVIGPEALADERFTPEESFMVARVNSRLDLKSILNVTPLREVEALRIVKRLMDRKIIAVKNH